MLSDRPLAFVIGDMDLVRPLGLAGIRSVVLAPSGASVRYSRFTCAVLDWADPVKQPDELVETLARFGASQSQPPVLFYEGDGDALLVSRYRERLARTFRFVAAEPALVEDLLDKGRFQILAERLHLPVPQTRRLSPDQGAALENVNLDFPLIVKPLTRCAEGWMPIAGSAKALQLNRPEELRALWQRMAAAGVDAVAQELVPGPETCIESYHTYVDDQGEIVGEFTGRKIRTYPVEYGQSTALVITDCPEVATLGRELTRRLSLRGVAKFDFKRGPDGKLRLLEINPRFNLWHHPGALAGVNLPALVYGDLAGLPRPCVPRARSGVRWCRLQDDRRAAREWHVPLHKWLPWALACEAKSAVAWDDPMPLVRRLLRQVSWLRSGSSSIPITMRRA